MRTLFLLLIFFAINVNARIPNYLLQDKPQVCKHNTNDCSSLTKVRTAKSNKLLSKQALDTNLNVEKYDLFLDWSSLFEGDETKLSSKIFTGIQNISFMLENNANSIKLNAANLIIDSIVFADSKLTNFTLQENILDIQFPKTLISNNAYNVLIYYHNNGVLDNGFYLYPKGEIQSEEHIDTNLHKIAYTNSEPELARNWMPCNDVPNDKSLIKTSVKVPAGYQVASNGTLIEEIKENIGNTDYITYVWESKHTTSTYIMAVFASKYSIIKDFYYREIIGDTIPILNYVWQEDSLGNFANGDSYDAKSSLKQAPEMLKAYSQLFGIEYPYEKYGHAAVQPYEFGGMENQTMTAIHREWLQGKAELGVAHEIAHHWLGNLITCDTWQDIWINEGGATWSEYLWLYYKNRNLGEAAAKEIYNTTITGLNWLYLSKKDLFDKIMNALPTDLMFVYDDITYTKASWVYHMLYRRLENKFLSFLNVFINKHRDKNVSSKDFELDLAEFVKQNNIDFDASDFFNQIVYTSGHPYYNITMHTEEKDNNKNNYKMTIEQVQSGKGFKDVYNYELLINCYKNGALDTNFKVFNNQRVQTYDIMLNNAIDSVNIDISYTLCNLQSHIVSVKDVNFDISELKISPNPAIAGTNVSIDIPQGLGNDLDIEIYDLMGHLQFQDNNIYQRNSSFIYTLNSQSFVSGTYILLIRSENGVYSKKFIVIKN
ncbi:MAG TPA: M1 family aminopeptidase [Candidatus Kapabacteria bacterium]|nr:M1 family aminopeptidase [Candidatus Kapabacteria bacterium]